jgi:hypothetical protein
VKDSTSPRRIWRICLALAFVFTGFTAFAAIRGFPATPAWAADAVTNGGFETGSLPPWVVPITGNNPTPTVSSAQAHSGTYSAFLGTPGVYYTPEPLGDSIIYQTIVVPAAGGLLSYWYRPYTSDNIGFDWQDAYITNTSGTILATIMHVDSNSQTWTNVVFNMAAFAFQTVRVEFLVHQDGFGDPTSMFVDDVSLAIASTTPVPNCPATPLICHNLPYVSANSLSTDTHHYISFVARWRSYTPSGYRGDLDYRDFDTGFFINGYGAQGFSTSPGINAPRSTYCSSYAANRPYCQLTIDSILCPGSGYGAQVYGHYTVNSTDYYWLINVNAGSAGTGTFMITSQTVAGAIYVGPTISVNTTIQCS